MELLNLCFWTNSRVNDIPFPLLLKGALIWHYKNNSDLDLYLEDLPQKTKPREILCEENKNP